MKVLQVYDCWGGLCWGGLFWGGLCWGEVVELMHEHKLVAFVNLCDIYIQREIYVFY